MHKKHEKDCPQTEFVTRAADIVATLNRAGWNMEIQAETLVFQAYRQLG